MPAGQKVKQNITDFSKLEEKIMKSVCSSALSDL